MANYQWVGGTGNTISKYDWNVPSNWRIRLWNGQAGTWYYVVPAYAPGPEDVAGIGGVFTSNLTCNSPLIFGGYSGSASGGGWAGSVVSSGGHTFNTSMAAITVQIDGGTGSIAYPFNYLGGGFTGEVYDWAFSTNTFDGGLSGQAIPDLSDSRTQSLKAKTTQFQGSLMKRQGKTSFVFVKNFTHPDGSTGAALGSAGSGTAGIIVNGFNAVNAGNLSVQGGSWATFNLSPDYTSGLSANPKSTVRDMFCREISTKSHTFLFDSGVTAGKVEVVGGNFYPTHDMRFLGTIDMNNVLEDAYIPTTAGITGSYDVEDSTLILGEVTTFGSRFPFCPFTFGDYETKRTSRAGQILVRSSTQRSEGPIYPCPWSLEFGGNVKVNTVRSFNSTVSASSAISNTAKVEIGTVRLDSGSLLDFGAYSSFDNWLIGSNDGSITGGGIIFDDELSSVGGSKGLRLFASQTQLGGRFDSRVFATTKNPSKNTLPNAPETA